MMNRKIIFALSGVLLFLWLAGCAPLGTAFTPEQAVIREISSMPHGSNIVIDQGSIQVRQTMQTIQRTFVMVSYSRIEGVRRDQCLMLYEAARVGLAGWISNGGGGGCTGSTTGEALAAAPVEISSGQSSGSGPADPGNSQAYGLVNQADIVKARVTWIDGQVQEVSVINNSYLVIRSGGVSLQKIEGLSAAGSVLYAFEQPAPAPGKQ